MTQFIVLLQKEFRENWRSFKLLWIPLVFVLLGVSDPITNYYMMDILAAVGNVPEGFELLIPEMAPADLLQASTGQFQMVGLIVLIASYVGVISRERKNGTATLVYVRPISFASYFMSKWVIVSVVAAVSVAAGYAGSVYYTTILYGHINFGELFAAVMSYLLWIILVVTLTLAMSATFSTVVGATCTFVLVFIGMFVDSLFGTYWSISPWKLSTYGMQFLYDGPDMGQYWLTVSCTVVAIIVFMALGIFASKRNAASTKI